VDFTFSKEIDPENLTINGSCSIPLLMAKARFIQLYRIWKLCSIGVLATTGFYGDLVVNPSITIDRVLQISTNYPNGLQSTFERERRPTKVEVLRNSYSFW
jgi:hypothetical protein